jgi:biopolymer transport protein ExbB
LFRGGWFMVPLALISVAVVAIGVERFLTLRREKLLPAELLEQLALLSKSPAGLEPRRVYRICQTFPSSAAYVLRAALVKVGRPQAEIETSVSEAAQREATRLSQLTSWLSLAAAIAPLIGLLGTVWGITQAFYDTTQMSALGTGQNRGVALANGIYVALVTTIAGLTIAIPATVLAHFFENRIIKSLNEISEMTKNLIPQFERYEGQVRFMATDSETALADSALSGSNHSGTPHTPNSHLSASSHLSKTTSASHTPTG